MYKVEVTNQYGRTYSYHYENEVAATTRANRESRNPGNKVYIYEVASWKAYVPKVYILVWQYNSYTTETRTYRTLKGLKNQIYRLNNKPYKVYSMDWKLDETLSSQG